MKRANRTWRIAPWAALLAAPLLMGQTSKMPDHAAMATAHAAKWTDHANKAPAPADETPLAAAPALSFHDRLLAAQNRERSALGIDPLAWNPDLAAEAQAWADHLAQSGQFAHAGPSVRGGAGENLWAGTRGAYSPDEMVDAWAREKRAFTPGPFPADTQSVHAIGHYTQIVWRHSFEVGCGVATGRAMDYLVCRYRNPGNVVGQTPY